MLGICGVMCIEDAAIRTVSSLNILDHNLPNISSTYITPHTPNNNFLSSDILYFYVLIYLLYFIILP